MDKPELFALKQGVKSEGTKILAREMLKNVYERILIACILAFYYIDIKLKGILVFLVVFLYTILATNYKPYRLESNF